MQKYDENESLSEKARSSNQLANLINSMRRSDPFFRDQQESSNKENINPNIKSNRVKSHQSKIQNHLQPSHRSPIKKIVFVKHGVKPTSKNTNSKNISSKSLKEQMALNSNNQSNSSEKIQILTNIQGIRRKLQEQLDSDRLKSEYYQSQKMKKKEDKVKVTLKQIKRHRQSLQSYQQQLSNKLDKDSNTKNTLSSLSQDYGSFEINKFNTEQAKQPQKQAQLVLTCLNHPQKAANYRLYSQQSQNEPIYCTKCAVMLVTQGFKIKQLIFSNTVCKGESVNTQSLARIEKLKNLLFELDKVEHSTKETNQYLNVIKKSLRQQFERQSFKLNQYYYGVKSQIDLMQKQSSLQLKLFYDSAIEQVQKHEDAINCSYAHIVFIKEDTVPNLESIADEKNLKNQDFQLIINEHQQKINKSKSIIQQIHENQFFCYEYKYENYDKQTTELKRHIQPQICEKMIDQQLNRYKDTENYNRQCDPFRMSFGKQIKSPTFKVI